MKIAHGRTGAREKIRRDPLHVQRTDFKPPYPRGSGTAHSTNDRKNDTENMKLWQKSNDVDREVERFTVGRDREMDLYLAEADVLGSLAHTRIL